MYYLQYKTKKNRKKNCEILLQKMTEIFLYNILLRLLLLLDSKREICLKKNHVTSLAKDYAVNCRDIFEMA